MHHFLDSNPQFATELFICAEKVPEEKWIMSYTKDNIEIMLSAAGIRKNDITKRDNREILDITIDL